MSDLGNSWELNDYTNAEKAWAGQANKSHHQVIVWKFDGYDAGKNINPNEVVRTPRYIKRSDHVWLSTLKGFDAAKAGIFLPGDISVNSTFLIQGYSAAYTLPDGMPVPEYSGDYIQWNGSLWAVADQLEPIQWGYDSRQVFYVSILRRNQRVGDNSRVGP